MRISDQRYSRDLRRYNLALRFIEHEARTQTICDWTGLSNERVRNLWRSYVTERGAAVAVRHRGPSPQRLSFFTHSLHRRSEAAALAGLCYLLDVIPSQPLIKVRRELPSVSRGERLCSVFEIYKSIAPRTAVTLEHVVLLVIALAQNNELEISNCVNCRGIVLISRYDRANWKCPICHRYPGDAYFEKSENPSIDESSYGFPEPQRNLF